MLLKMFDKKTAMSSAELLAKIVTTMVQTDGDKADVKYQKRLNSAMRKLQQQIDWLKLQHKLNFYQRAQLGNQFRWTLVDAGYDEKFTKDITAWVLVQYNKT